MNQLAITNTLLIAILALLILAAASHQITF